MHALALSLVLAAAPDPFLPNVPLAPPEADDGRADPSVYRVGRLDVLVTALATAAAIAPNQFPTQLVRQRICAAPGSCPTASLNPLDRVAVGMHSRAADVVSDVTVGLAIALPVIADGLRLGVVPAFREDLWILAQTVAVNAAVVTGVKYAVQRPLPVTYARRDGLPEQAQGYRGFYSGHTSTAVAALTASAWTLRFRDGPRTWPWIVTGAVGGSVAVERVLAGRHFPTDVVVGAAAGFAVGTIVPWLHVRRPPGARDARALRLVPDGRGLALAGAW